jgi:hypothetical protein
VEEAKEELTEEKKDDKKDTKKGDEVTYQLHYRVFRVSLLWGTSYLGETCAMNSASLECAVPAGFSRCHLISITFSVS